MLNFYDETILRLGLSPEETVGWKATVFSMRGVAIEGHSGLVALKDDEVVFRIKRQKLYVRGEGLKLTEMSADEAFVRGKISSVGVDNG